MTAILQGVISPIVRQVSAGYSATTVCRGLLSNLALQVGSLPEVRRLVCQFSDKAQYPERPMLTLCEGHPSVYLLGWREGDFTDIHDHGDCEVGVYVIQGIVTEDIYATTALRKQNRRCILSFSRQLQQGSLMTCPRHYIHRIGNIFPEVAATLHVYGPALDDMRLYDMKGSKLAFREHWHAAQEPQH